MFLFGRPKVEKMKARRDAAGLIKALGYRKDWSVRQDAAGALGELGDVGAIPPLVDVLQKDEHGYVRSAAAKALGKIGDPCAVEPLIAALRDGNVNVRSSAVEALGQIGDARAIEPLIPMLWRWDVSKAAAQALDCLGWQPGQDEAAARYWMAKQNWEKCASLGNVAVNTAIALLRESAQDGAWAQSMMSLDRFSHPGAGWGIMASIQGWECVEKRETAGKVLTRIGAPAVLPLITALQDESSWMKMTTAWVLGELRDARAVKPLVLLLKDKKALTGGDCLCDCLGQVVVEALVKVGTPAVEPLMAALENDDAGIRQRVIWALGEIGDVRAVAPLKAMLEDWSVRSSVIEALKKMGGSGLPQ